MQLVRHIADLDHLRHVLYMNACAAHVNVARRTSTQAGRFARCATLPCMPCAASRPLRRILVRLRLASHTETYAAPTDRPYRHGRAGTADPPLRASRLRGRRRFPCAPFAPGTQPLLLVLS